MAFRKGTLQQLLENEWPIYVGRFENSNTFVRHQRCRPRGLRAGPKRLADTTDVAARCQCIRASADGLTSMVARIRCVYMTCFFLEMLVEMENTFDRRSAFLAFLHLHVTHGDVPGAQLFFLCRFRPEPPKMFQFRVFALSPPSRYCVRCAAGINVGECQ